MLSHQAETTNPKQNMYVLIYHKGIIFHLCQAD